MGCPWGGQQEGKEVISHTTRLVTPLEMGSADIDMAVYSYGLLWGNVRVAIRIPSQLLSPDLTGLNFCSFNAKLH